MIPRVLEPEVMDTAEEAADYDAMNHAEVNRRFVEELLAWISEQNLPKPNDILDVGTGTAQIPIEFCGQSSDGHVTAIDLSREMLKLAAQNVAKAGCSQRISLQHVDAKRLPFETAPFDLVMSNSIIHHIPEPGDCFSEMIRVLKPTGVLFVRDLMRPDSEAELEQLVETYAGEENEHSRQMFRESLHAALTVEDVQQYLRDLDLPTDWVRPTSDRHWTIAGQLPEA